VVYASSAVNNSVNGNIPGAYGVAVASNGDIIAGGTESNAGLTSIAVWAFKTSGAPDTSFGSGGTTVTGFGGTTRGEGNGLAIGSDGKIVVAGDIKAITGTYSSVVSRYIGFTPPPPPPPPPPPALKASLKGVSGRYKTSSVAKRGLKVGVNCNVACTFSASLTLSAGTAKRLHIVTTIKKCTKVKGKRRCVKAHVYRTVTIASGKGRVRSSGTSSITLKLAKKYVKTLEKQKSISVSLQVAVTSTHNRRTIKKGLTFKR
jgi:hypothetical protein